jgi:uncharacterized protein
LCNVVKVFIGPETHCRSRSFTMFDEHLRFFDRYLKGVENGIDTEPPIQYYTYNAPAGQEWAFSDTWPVKGTTTKRLFLAAPTGELGLSDTVPEPGAAEFVTDYSVITGSPTTPYWPTSQHGHGVSFTTAPFTEDVRITGHPEVSLQISTTATDGDVFAYLEEISPDGEVAIRAHGRLRASHRRLGTPPYGYLGLPWHRSFREDYLPMEPGVPAELCFDLLPTSTIVQRGARLRLVVTAADPRQRRFMRTDPPPVVTLHLGGSTPSFIDLPVVPLIPVPVNRSDYA